MSRKLKREEDLVEQLERKVRELKAENRALTRRLKKVDRDYDSYIEEVEKERHLQEDEGPKTVVKRCPICERGEIIETLLGKTKFYRCSISECNNKGRYK